VSTNYFVNHYFYPKFSYIFRGGFGWHWSRVLAVKEEEDRKLPQQRQSRGYRQLTREKAADARFPR